MTTTKNYTVTVYYFGSVDSDLVAAAEQFAESVDLSGIDLTDLEATDRALMRLFAAATPEYDSPRGSRASDPRSAFCFGVVLQ